MQRRRCTPETSGVRIRINIQTPLRRTSDRFRHTRRWRIGVLVGVQLHPTGFLRLLARHVTRHLINRWTKNRSHRCTLRGTGAKGSEEQKTRENQSDIRRTEDRRSRFRPPAFSTGGRNSLRCSPFWQSLDPRFQCCGRPIPPAHDLAGRQISNPPAQSPQAKQNPCSTQKPKTHKKPHIAQNSQSTHTTHASAIPADSNSLLPFPTDRFTTQLPISSRYIVCNCGRHSLQVLPGTVTRTETTTGHAFT